MQLRGKYENTWFKAGPVLGKPVSAWRYTRPQVAAEECNGCGMCYLYCPTGCVSEAEDGEHFVVNYDYCKGCGVCAHECPAKAITMVSESEEAE